MAEYTGREATCGECLHAEICEQMPTLTGFDPTNIAYCKAFRNAADVVEVVRCENCKHMDDDGWCCVHDTPMDSIDFCSYGERKSDVL